MFCIIIFHFVLQSCVAIVCYDCALQFCFANMFCKQLLHKDFGKTNLHLFSVCFFSKTNQQTKIAKKVSTTKCTKTTLKISTPDGWIARYKSVLTQGAEPDTPKSATTAGPDEAETTFEVRVRPLVVAVGLSFDALRSWYLVDSLQLQF